MSKQIWKYPLGVQALTTLQMPEYSKVLCVQVQRGTPCIWAIGDPEQVLRNRVFRIVGTGIDIYNDSCMVYIGTFQVDSFVGHVFEEL